MVRVSLLLAADVDSYLRILVSSSSAPASTIEQFSSDLYKMLSGCERSSLVSP